MHRDGRKGHRNHHVTARCIAIVLKRKANDISHTDNSSECQQTDAQTERVNPLDFDTKVGSSNANKSELVQFDAKKVFEDFKLRNKTCYWNPALADSVKRLEYNGFIEPLTILCNGDDIHLENVRTAWSRRVLKDPAYFLIDRIGDVNGIEMEVVPQTQFIPLPEALCLLILELNNSQIVATLDVICERLEHCYQGLCLPSNQLVYDTLGQLIREHKLFHTGCGYFIVTPNTFRMHGDDPFRKHRDEAQLPSFFSPWTHLHPMYIPSAFSQPPRQPMRSISCQVEPEETFAAQKESCYKQKDSVGHSEKLNVDLPSQKIQRSLSLSGRKSREKSQKENVDGGLAKRGSFVKGKIEMNMPKEEEKSEQKTEKKEKMSLFAKIFGRNKKKPYVEPKKPVVEYATFSAQFPPPEWMWYQQQLDRQLRTETWVQQQLAKSGTWCFLQNLSSGSVNTSLQMGVNSLPERTSALPFTAIMKSDSDKNFGVTRRSNRKFHPSKHRSPVVIGDIHGECAQIDQKHTFRNSMGQTNIKLSSLPTRISPAKEMLPSDFVTHTLFSSPTIPERPKSTKEAAIQSIDQDNESAEPHMKNIKSLSLRNPHKSKRKNHQDRHSYFNQSSRHVTVNKERMSTPFANEINYQHHGYMPKKHCVIGISQSSGVNCIDLDSCQHHTRKGQDPVQQHLYRHSDRSTFNEQGSKSNEYDSPRYERSWSGIHDHNAVNETADKHDFTKTHIYANVQISNIDPKPKLPERTSRKGHNFEKLTLLDGTSCSTQFEADSKLQLPENDRNSECGSDVETNTSYLSQEPGSQDSSTLEGIASSEHSMGTVINTRVAVNRQMEAVVADAKDLTLLDSGFSSPRVSENSSDNKKKDNISSGENNPFMCNNLKSGSRLNNATGKLEECSDDSFDRLSSDKLYENVSLSHREVLNNMKYLQKDVNVSSQNLTVLSVAQGNSGTVLKDFDPKNSIAKKFNFEGDFHVVGVV